MYLLKLAQGRHSRSSVAHRARKVCVSGRSFLDVAAALARSKKPVGSNPLFAHVNAGLQMLRTRGRSGRMDGERKALANDYRASVRSDAGRHTAAVNGWLREQRARRGAARPRGACDEGLDLNELDPKTHFGFGSSMYPFTAQAWQRTLSNMGCNGNLGGTRQAADHCLLETSLVVACTNRRLRLPVGWRSCCAREHRGLCVADGPALVSRALCFHSHLQTLAKEPVRFVARFVPVWQTL